MQAPSTISEPTSQEFEFKSTVGCLDWIDRLDIEASRYLDSSVNVTPNIKLEGTCIACVTCNKETGWEERKTFLREVLTDIISHCPKDEPFALISLGPDHLLMEYILGKGLIEAGFHQISFLMVEPSWKVPSERIDVLLKDFRRSIEKVYETACNAPFPKDNIRYLSRAQNISKYFTKNTNVALVECLPPYSSIIQRMADNGTPVKKPEDLFAGSYIVDKSEANSIAILPNRFVSLMGEFGENFVNTSMPLEFFNLDASSDFCYVDWGCKIEPNGSFHVSFSGYQDYIAHSKAKFKFPDNLVYELTNHKKVTYEEWIPAIKKLIECELLKQIEEIKAGDETRVLTQQEVTGLLSRVNEIVTSEMEDETCFFLADYHLDRKDALSFLSKWAGCTYRKMFTFEKGTTSTTEIV